MTRSQHLPPIVLLAGLVFCCIADRALRAADRAAVLAELQDYSLTGMDRRHGPDYDFYHRSSPKETFPDVYLAPPLKHGGPLKHYEIGKWTAKAGDFSSTQGQVLYVPDPGYFPVDRVTILEWTNGCFTESPEPPWHGGFRPEPAAAKWKQAVPDGDVGMPIAIARGMGYWANNGLTIFSSGLVAAAGTVTARGLEPTLRFPSNKILTGISITNKSEFALITLHDTQTHRGQVAVLSMRVDGKHTRFVHEWQDDHAWSLPSVALLVDLKLLGYIDLPGIEFPTAICAVGNDLNNRMNGRDGNAGLLREYDLAKQADRDVFLKGANAHFGSTAGFAVVAAKYENKAALLDLRPLFQTVRQMYFGSEENYQKTRHSGQEPQEWPYAFDAQPNWKPSVVRVIDVPRPTAVLASLAGGQAARAMIASEDGTIGIYQVDGLGTEAPPVSEKIDPVCNSASARQLSAVRGTVPFLLTQKSVQSPKIERVAEITVGRNPTWLAYQKSSRDTFIAVSRGDRELVWVNYAKDEPRIVRRLRDARLLDPVYAEVADTHGIQTSLVTVADFHGRKILNYRYSPVIFATQGGAKYGMGIDGKADFECGGVLEFPGSPFAVSATNVN